MAQQPHPDDPYRSNDLYRPSNPSRANFRDDDLRPAARLDNELQVDPELAEGPAGGGRIALEQHLTKAGLRDGVCRSTLRRETR